MNNSMFTILLVLIVPVGIFFVWRSSKKKKEQQASTPTSGKKKKQESEAWTTIKTYLKDHNENGKEIVELFVVKRPEQGDTTNLNKEQKKQLTIKEKEKKIQDKLSKKQDPQAYKERKSAEKKQKHPEQWMLYFTTRNPKTKIIDEPRLIEANITYVKRTKKETDRVIKVNDRISLEKEMLWIKPLKDKEDQTEIKNKQAQEKKNLKHQQKEKIKKSKKVEKIQAEKIAANTEKK